ncbi:TPA: hypothetical protein RJJ74_002415, partial [Staphylococcus pseudintermedius]|nr:hypothetical protein [Staphylococcus pseudintermedius]
KALERRITIRLTLDQQINELMSYQPNLVLTEDNEKFILKGPYDYDLKYKTTRYRNTRDIEAHIYKTFPKSDIKLYLNEVPPDMEHINSNGTICLATSTEIRSFLRLNPTISEFINEFFHSFFFSLEWYERYKKYPFGERSHGSKGILEYYLDKWNLNEEVFFKIALMIWNRSYRGHVKCVCGSGIKMRKCHGKYIVDIIRDDTMLASFIWDVIYIYNLEMEVSNEKK